jgi:hypothetical protein
MIMNIFNNLPYDLQLMIYSYIIFPQNKSLLDDIKSYHNIKRLIYIKYLNRGLIYNDDYSEYLNIHVWIQYGLMIYWNKNKPINKKIAKNNNSLINRHLLYRIKHKNNNDPTIYNIYNNLTISCKFNINTYIGSLKNHERLHFINTN